MLAVGESCRRFRGSACGGCDRGYWDDTQGESIASLVGGPLTDLCSDPGTHACKAAVEFYDEIAAEPRKLASTSVFPSDRNFVRDLLCLAIH